MATARDKVDSGKDSDHGHSKSRAKQAEFGDVCYGPAGGVPTIERNSSSDIAVATCLANPDSTVGFSHASWQLTDGRICTLARY